MKTLSRSIPSTKALTVNPKDLLGNKKVSITKLPAVAMIHGAHAMMNGAEKYGAYNWRSKPVIASIYIDAIERHALAWFEGHETATDSGVHHLGHLIASAAILLDAIETGNLVDDRPFGENRNMLDGVLNRLSGIIVSRREAAALRAKKAASQKKRARTLKLRARSKRVKSASRSNGKNQRQSSSRGRGR